VGFAAAFTTCIDVAAARGITLKHLATNRGRDVSAADSSVRFTALARLLRKAKRNDG
jgi:hypothetical protein